MRLLRGPMVGLAALLLAACSTSGGREVTITASDEGCSPAVVTATPGEKLTLVVKNEAKGDREIEGIEGTRLEEVIIPTGRTRNVNYTMPRTAGVQKAKCYIPGGLST